MAAPAPTFDDPADVRDADNPIIAAAALHARLPLPTPAGGGPSGQGQGQGCPGTGAIGCNDANDKLSCTQRPHKNWKRSTKYRSEQQYQPAGRGTRKGETEATTAGQRLESDQTMTKTATRLDLIRLLTSRTSCGSTTKRLR